MRLRNVKNKEIILKNSSFLISNPEQYCGDWKKVFDNENPIEIEVGMGKGNFIIQKALENPNINFIGIEKHDSVVARAVEKIPEDLTNLKIIMIDAINLDTTFCKEVSKMYLNFSDPWPKKRHANRRLTSKVFLSKYDNIFNDGKVICQKTDNKDLFEYSIVSFSEYGYVIKEISLDLHNSDITNNIMTEYEEKFSAKGNPIYYVCVEKE